LAEHKLMKTYYTSEFKLEPQEGAKGSNIPYNIDGDPLEPNPIHVRVLKQKLNLFALPDAILEGYVKKSGRPTMPEPLSYSDDSTSLDGDEVDRRQRIAFGIKGGSVKLSATQQKIFEYADVS